MRLVKIFLACTVLSLTACGGGGGGSNTPAPNPPGGGTGGGTGGGGSGSGTVVTGGLVSGGVGVVVDTSSTGVLLDVAVGGTGLVAGDIQDFGSVIANGITTNTDDAIFTVEGQVGTQADLKQGQQVLIVGDSGSNTASQVLYRANIKGPVTAAVVEDIALGRATYTVFGQTVTTDATTTFANVNIANIGVGELLEVSGAVEANGELAASFIELKTSLAEYKVTGQVKNLTATDFSAGGLTVDFSNATLSDFASGTLTEDDVVEVRGDPITFTAPAQFTASEVERLPILTVGSDAIVRIEGFIDRFASTTDFDVQTTPVTTNTSTTFVNGDLSSLALAVKVQIEGTATVDGAVVAESITIQPTKAIRVEGNIETLDLSAETVTVLGVNFAIRDLTELEDDSSAAVEPLTLSDLGIGDEVEIRGYLDGSTVVATSLEREDLEDRARLRGPVTAENAGAGTVDILGITITGQDGVTEFQDADDNVITQTQFHEAVDLGDIVTVRWNVYASTSEVADQLSLSD